MKLFYSCDFIEDGETIDLISIGMVAEDGREFYAISDDFSFRRLSQHAWLMANVAPSLPIKYAKDGGPWDGRHPDYGRIMARYAMADHVHNFIRDTPNAELWSWYSAYGHVALCQLFGRMIDLPPDVPMYTNDLKQEAVRLGNPVLPNQPDGVSNTSLEDAGLNLLRARELGILNR